MQEEHQLPADAIRLISGLTYQVLEPGTGDESPGPEDMVQVLFEAGSDADRLFETQIPAGVPRTFLVKDAVPGVAEAVQLMTVGRRLRVWLPGKEKLTFEMELSGFTRMREPRLPPPELRSPRRED